MARSSRWRSRHYQISMYKNNQEISFLYTQWCSSCEITEPFVFGNKTWYFINTSSPHNVCDDHIIIDDIHFFSIHIPTIIRYFSCVTRAFTKYRLSFELNKCDFIQSFLEYVGHNLTAHDNCSAASKFDLLQSYTLARHGLSLHSFIGLCCFYNRYCPWFETNIKSLTK